MHLHPSQAVRVFVAGHDGHHHARHGAGARPAAAAPAAPVGPGGAARRPRDEAHERPVLAAAHDEVRPVAVLGIVRVTRVGDRVAPRERRGDVLDADGHAGLHAGIAAGDPGSLGKRAADLLGKRLRGAIGFGLRRVAALGDQDRAAEALREAPRVVGQLGGGGARLGRSHDRLLRGRVPAADLDPARPAPRT